MRFAPEVWPPGWPPFVLVEAVETGRGVRVRFVTYLDEPYPDPDRIARAASFRSWGSVPEMERELLLWAYHLRHMPRTQ